MLCSLFGLFLESREKFLVEYALSVSASLEDGFWRVAVVHKASHLVDRGSVRAEEIGEASRKTADDIGFVDVVSAVGDSFCDSFFGELKAGECEVYELYGPTFVFEFFDETQMAFT